MKTKIKNLTAAILSVLLLFSPVALTGCNGARTAQGIAFQTLKTTQIAVDKAMKVYGTACATGRVSVAKQAQIDDIHARYRAAFRLAVTATRNDPAALTPEAVASLADELQTLITSL